MTWFLFALGLVLVIWGLWGANPPVPPRARTEEPDEYAGEEGSRERAWEVLARPVTQERETKITRRRRFWKGLAAGAGAGMIVAAVVLANMGRTDQPEPRAPGGAVPPDTKQPSSQPPPAATPPPAPPPAAPQPAQRDVAFTISPGEAASEIAENLVAAGVIRDAALFVDRLIARGLESMLKAGEFNLKTEMSIDEVIDILTS